MALRALTLCLALALTSPASAADTPEKDPRNWPTVSRLMADRYEMAGRVFTLRVHAKKTDYFNCAYRGANSRLMAFTLLGGPHETLTGYIPRELGTLLASMLEADPWTPLTVDVRFDPDKLTELCPDQVDILEWSPEWKYPPNSLTPGRPDATMQPTPEGLTRPGSRTMWKELGKLASSYVGKRIQLRSGARVSTAYHCAFRGATRSHFAIRLHDARGRFIHGYLPRSARARKLLDFIALHRDVGLTVQGRVVKLAMSSYCRPQLEITSWTLPNGG
ncbi:MAG: hypothetical protein ACI9MR_000600 [Myxococcota bacterium]|jgi:hypothetical protein